MIREDQRFSAYFVAVAAIFVTCLVVSNIIAVKLIAVGGLILPAAIIIFPLSYLLADILTEVYGFRAARRVIWLGFFCNLVAVIAIYVGGMLPAAVFWPNQGAYDSILGATPRILGASFVAYLAGEFLNSLVLAKMKVATSGRWLWMRTIGSTLAGEGVDSLIFITLAFAGTMAGGDLARVVVTQWLFKSVYEAVATPLTYALVGFLKTAEREDYYDRETDFSPFRLEA